MHGVDESRRPADDMSMLVLARRIAGIGTLQMENQFFPFHPTVAR